ncbi:YraN family protein [Candidatus Gracilibacteria bacterium]|nr:YraN family protein [Candidatus Gracilibacteria bacterium]
MPSAEDGRRATGRFGESAAAAALLRSGYTLVAQGWRCSLGEIDLIAMHGDQVVFVEVRTRRGDGAAESVDSRKRRKLTALAQHYLAARQLPDDTAWRIDVIAVTLDRGGRLMSVEHIPYAVEDERGVRGMCVDVGRSRWCLVGRSTLRPTAAFGTHRRSSLRVLCGLGSRHNQCFARGEHTLQRPNRFWVPKPLRARSPRGTGTRRRHRRRAIAGGRRGLLVR